MGEGPEALVVTKETDDVIVSRLLPHGFSNSEGQVQKKYVALVTGAWIFIGLQVPSLTRDDFISARSST